MREPFSGVPDPRGYDLAGFGYPVHAFNVPEFFMRFVKRLPAAPGLPAFIFKTSGEPFAVNSASSLPLARLLRKKGMDVLFERHLLMPYNIVFRYPDALAAQMYRHTSEMAALIAGNAAAGRREKINARLWAIPVSYFFRIQRLGTRLNGPHIKADTSLCTGCGLCAARCPAKNIVMRDGRPVFGKKCTMCMSCAFRCPGDAVRPGFLNGWRVNGPYDFSGAGAEDYVNSGTRGYFRHFRSYYRRTGRELEEFRRRGE